MKPHPDFEGSTLPRNAEVGPYRLTPLSVAQVNEDFAAVTGSERVLRGVFGGDWPEGLTRGDNLIDMAWHEREFTQRRSFAWIIRDAAGTYLGCAYLYPDIFARGSGEVVTWFCDTPARHEHLRTFYAAFDRWLAAYLPAAYNVRWTSNDGID